VSVSFIQFRGLLALQSNRVCDDMKCCKCVADRRAQFEKLEYTEEDYQEELEHIEQVFAPLVEKCKKYGRALRIGTNHGSLSDRIMSYYGDSPRGMVSSIFPFLL
jgi:(E)-4-hydroxy-3-methylbut-2-enyl-diphosphate synthase